MLDADGFVMPWKARYFEVDQQGVVFNAWYLTWFDEAMSGFLAHHGLDAATLVREGLDFQLVRSEIDWRAGVRWGEAVEIAVRPGRIGTTSFDLHFSVRRGGEETCTAKIVYVSVAPDGSGKRPVPDALQEILRT
ncbi:thioesterase family protein [Dactylosporangium sp. NPDC005572]|uniref:acyl-CoA thioesterase n=1 Tax=Dactylosporangium sp. NPDC005572 TaxID=3156889 RepID=UPI00339F3287